MLFPHTLDRVQLHGNLLSRSQLGEHYISVRGTRWVGFKQFILFALRFPDQVSRRNNRVVIDLLWLRFRFLRSTSDCGFRFPCTHDIQLEYEGVTVGGLVLCVGFEFKVRRIRAQWNQADTVSKDFILDHGSVVPNIYMFDGNRRDLVYGEAMKFFPEGEAERTYRTSAMSILRKAFAIDASTPTRSNWIDRWDSLLILTCNFCEDEP